MNILKVKKFLTFKPFNRSSEQGRSDERHRLAVLSFLASLASRGISMLVIILTVTLTIPYLGAERFGVWMTIASFVGMLGFLDLGVGNALTNKVSQAAAKEDLHKLQQTISGGLGVLFILGCTVGMVLFNISDHLPWEKIVKVNNLLISNEVRDAVKLLSLLLALSIFTNGLQRIYFGLQKAFIPHLVALVGSLLSLLTLLIATKVEASIPYLLAATLGVQLLASLSLLLNLYHLKLIRVIGIFNSVKLETKELLFTGGIFLILQVGTMVGWGGDNLIIASTLGASQVAIFSIVQRLFQFISQPLGMLNSPLWGAYADAHTRGEKEFIRKIYKKSMLATLFLSTVFGFVLYIFSDYIIKVWSKGSIVVSSDFVFIFFIWTIFETTGNSFAMMMNGCGIIRIQAIAVLLFVVIAIPLKLILVKYGLTYLVIATLIAYSISVPLFYSIFARKQIRNLFR
jgi:O-antigen/teichoic acid export membrane protein